MPANTTRAPSDSSRQRRAHLKSRNGCVRCKRLRKKCDEGQPRCARCVKQGTDCEYANATDGGDEATSSGGGVSELHGRRAVVASDSDVEMRDSLSTDPTSAHRPASSHLHAARSHADSAMPPAAPSRTGSGGSGLPMLSARELELFSHYITHTSRVIPHGREDMFPLQVGMPNLAFSNPAVMDSILALAASCKCHDMLLGGDGAASSDRRLGGICELLRLADRHHQAALGQLQSDICERQFRSVLPNAALMVLYALSCHYVRVLLARRAARLGARLAKDVLPFQSQWITSIRAAHVAFVGLLQPGLRSSSASSSSAASPGLNSEEDEDGDNGEEAALLVSPLGLSEADRSGADKFQDGPAEETRRLLLPIVASTYESALRKLRVRNAADLEGDAKLEACGAALGLLEELFQVIVGGGDAVPPPRKDAPRPHDFGALDDVPPWLVRYLARVTSATPSRLWRRRIMAFLNQVPFEFLHLVQLALDCMPVEESRHHEPSSPSLGDSGVSSSAPQPLPLEAAHKPAMDIFAHWLVLVMLLDGVWWIGDVGHWELGRIARFIEAQGFALDLAEGETWWPETMHAVKSTLGGGAA
ncbi:Zn(2)-C6 fungal-type DNA-binding domain protein [Cordyceps fumosorosea ARSEF 2679]|uniref:Zn(2)-C6 fungal-type DNA-binding domain protein n=1 Tax=Cordyceps fumosorosea (strain ARSEF 2679) TaxID=1081104 RepID=A0A167J1D6_CORFA|nr:Zn(2)-C6 fungal-type DNA-binding domain protein [Cordyceps fumosorosea ARSEF 2679]OAA49686.1 Zn(2)-C6 fungal-type DNA-binding domain protein [Cordyceps fumosorosea ARSEF 2679]